jgi:hypothetical protein
MVLKESLVLIRYYCVPQGQVRITHENAFAPTVQLSALAVEQRLSDASDIQSVDHVRVL